MLMKCNEISEEVQHFELSKEFLEHYQACCSTTTQIEGPSEVLGIEDYPNNLRPANLINQSTFFKNQLLNKETFELFQQNIQLIYDFTKLQLFSDDIDERRITRFALCRREDFRDDCQEFILDSLLPQFTELKISNKENELKVLIMMAIYFSIEDDASYATGTTSSSLDEYLKKYK